MGMFKFLIILIFTMVMVGCGFAATTESRQNPAPLAPAPVDTALVEPELTYAAPGKVSVKLVQAYPNLTFDRPLDFLHAGDGSGRIFVVEKTGKIKVFKNDPQVKSAQVFLDLSSLVDSSSSEKGLLGLAFHPDFKNNGFFYVNYTNRTNSVIARYQADPAKPSQGVISSKLVLITFPQPYANHNGGHLAFGADGFLYIGTGDGGSAGDPQNNAQNRSSFLGKILRIDVNKTTQQKPYIIPADNPFIGNKNGFKEEIYAYGLRNPWKFSFDQRRGWLWAADVGQDKVEEIDIIHNGANYGWNKMEGTLCYPSSVNCNQAGLTRPVWTYRHPIGGSITGGYVYYGRITPSLQGAYVYGDFVTGMIWALWLNNNLAAEKRTLLDTNLNISSFGLDEKNELYIVDNSGKIYRLIE